MVAAVGIRRPARLLATLTSVAVVALGAGCGVGSGPEGTIELTYVSYGGATQDAMIAAWQEPYQAAHPEIRFVNTSPPDAGQVQAQVQSGSVGWSIVSTPPWLAMANCGTVYERLSVPDLEEDQFPPGLHGECFVAAYRSPLIFSYNAKKWPDPAAAPQTIQDFFDVQKFPGKRGVVPALGDGILEWALIADGVDPAAVYPLDVDRALAKWSRSRSTCSCWCSRRPSPLSTRAPRSPRSGRPR
jgi:putative spermidine/putrescine transport system substrate-binding protein